MLTRYIGVTLNRLCSVSAMTDVDSKDTEVADSGHLLDQKSAKSKKVAIQMENIPNLWSESENWREEENRFFFSKFTKMLHNSHATIKL